MLREVPRYSQYLDVRNSFWQSRSCGIVALKMVLDYWYSIHPLRIPPPSLPSLIRSAHVHGAYVRNVGWSHRGLVAEARHFGFKGSNFDWASLSARAAFRKLLPLVLRGPVIASVYRNPQIKQGGHLVVITSISRTHVHLLEPAAKSRARISRNLTVSQFLRLWKQRIIVVRSRLRK
jgi:hypothetical protein